MNSEKIDDVIELEKGREENIIKKKGGERRKEMKTYLLKGCL